jgi:hypothetical protein
MENNKNKGYVLLPYKIITEAISINGEYVYYRNKWKNLLLKIKHFFVKPNYLKNKFKYMNKKINLDYYEIINVNNENK